MLVDPKRSAARAVILSASFFVNSNIKYKVKIVKLAEKILPIIIACSKPTVKLLNAKGLSRKFKIRPEKYMAYIGREP